MNQNNGLQNQRKRREVIEVIGSGLEHITDPLAGLLFVATIDSRETAESLVKTNNKLSNITFVYVEDCLVYEGFDADFGPLNLSCLYRFCLKVNGIITRKKKDDNHSVIVHLTTTDPRMRVNAAFLSGCFAVRFTSQLLYLVN